MLTEPLNEIYPEANNLIKNEQRKLQQNTNHKHSQENSANYIFPFILLETI